MNRIPPAIAACFALLPALHATEIIGMPEHAHLLFKRVTTTYELSDDARVTWTAKWAGDAQNTSAAAFEVTIDRPRAEPKVYSLLTLGLQTATNDVRIKVVQGDEVSFLNSNGKAIAAEAGVFLIPQTGLNPPVEGRTLQTVDSKQVCFLSFKTDKIVLKVEVLGRAKPHERTTDWERSKAYQTGHDNEPPKNPPD